SVTTTSRTSKTTVGSFIPLSATVGSVSGVSLRLRGRGAGGDGPADVGQGRIVPQRRLSASRLHPELAPQPRKIDLHRRRAPLLVHLRQHIHAGRRVSGLERFANGPAVLQRPASFEDRAQRLLHARAVAGAGTDLYVGHEAE